MQKQVKVRSRPLIPTFYQGRAVCVIPYAGADLSLYQMAIPNGLARPVSARMTASWRVYELSGDEEAVLAVIADQRPMTVRNSIRHVFRVLWIKFRGRKP